MLVEILSNLSADDALDIAAEFDDHEIRVALVKQSLVSS